MEGEVLCSKEFDGDIIITDPCYLVDNEKDWDFVCSQLGGVSSVLKTFGISDLTSKTYYGDWGCTLWKAKDYRGCTPENAVGEFCADAGLVTVARLSEVLKYNPNFEQWMDEHDWCVATIKDFHGYVEFFLSFGGSLELHFKDLDGRLQYITAQTSL